MRKQLIIFVLVFLPLGLIAQEQETYTYDEQQQYQQQPYQQEQYQQRPQQQEEPKQKKKDTNYLPISMLDSPNSSTRSLHTKQKAKKIIRVATRLTKSAL